jgi:PKD repeat protein
VRAQARGLGGLVLEETVSIRIQTGFPHAEFNFTGAPGNVVTFTNLSTGQQPLSCSWDFGAGANPGTSSSCASPIVVTYTTPGNKTVSLVVSNVLGSDTAVANFEVLP